MPLDIPDTPYHLDIIVFIRPEAELFPAGLNLYSPVKNVIHELKFVDLLDDIGKCLVGFQSELIYKLGILFFISSSFSRSTSNYGDKGFGFSLPEANHLITNLNLAATALELEVINIGVNHNRLVDQFLELEGLIISTINLIGLGIEQAEKT